MLLHELNLFHSSWQVLQSSNIHKTSKFSVIILVSLNSKLLLILIVLDGTIRIKKTLKLYIEESKISWNKKHLNYYAQVWMDTHHKLAVGSKDFNSLKSAKDLNILRPKYSNPNYIHCCNSNVKLTVKSVYSLRKTEYFQL